MLELAGFDVVGEIHRDTVVDFVNAYPFPDPRDGQPRYLFGGPFATDLNLDLGTLGHATVSGIVDVALQPVVHQPTAQLLATVTGGSGAVAGRTFYHLQASAVVRAPLGFTPDPARAGRFLPSVLLDRCPPAQVVLDPATAAQVEALLGPGSSAGFAAALGSALTAFLQLVVGRRQLPALGFDVVPGVDSSRPDQLSAVPQVAWIDTDTLGVFGYYTAAASGGDVTRKSVGDLAQPGFEGFYDQPGLFSVVPGVRLAVLLSPAGFHEAVACPLVHGEVVRTLVFQRERDRFLALVRDRDGASIRSQMLGQHLVEYFVDEQQSHPDQGLQADYDAAMARIQTDVDAAIDAEARKEENDWLDSSDGRGELDRDTPPPCGSGAVEAFRQRMPDPLPDLIAMLRSFGVTLGDGKLQTQSYADGEIDVIGIGVDFSVSVEVDATVRVDEFGRVIVDVTPQPPDVQVAPNTFLDVIVATLSDLIVGPFWGALFTYVGIRLGESIADKVVSGLIFDQLSEKLAGGVVGTGTSVSGFPVRAVDARIETDGVIGIGLIGRRPVTNVFSPGLVINAVVIDRSPSERVPTTGSIDLAATEWGCPAASFAWTQTFWDTTVAVNASLRDAPLPITVTGWQMQLGNFTYLIGDAIDPRPVWSNEPVPISAGTDVLSGEPFHVVPPFHGTFEERNDLNVTVTGDPDHGFQLRFTGGDGNFYVQFAVAATDGDGTQWYAETFVSIKGEQLDMDPAYAQYKADCDAKYNAWILLQMLSMGAVVAMGQVAPGQPVESDPGVFGMRFSRTLVTAGDLVAIEQLAQVAATSGADALAAVGHAPPLQLVGTPASLRLVEG